MLCEYARFEFCLDGEYTDDFVRMIYGMEDTLNRRSTNKEGQPVECEKDDIGYDDLRFMIMNPDKAAEVERLVEKIDSVLNEKIKNYWRWRILRLRTAIDVELVLHDMRLTARIEEYMEQLTGIYSAQNALYTVIPLTCTAVSRMHVKQP